MELYNPQVEFNKKEEKMYPERAFSSVDKSIERLKQLENGEVKKVELSEQERSEILSFENTIGTKFEEIFKIKVSSAGLHPEYLMTNQGRAFFRSCTGLDIEGDDLELIKKNLYKMRGRLDAVDGVSMKKLEGQLKKYSEEMLIEKIASTMTDSGEIDIDDIETVKPITVLLNPENALDKLQKLRNFKQTLKIESLNFSKEDKSENYGIVLRDILEQYKRRVNEVIVDQFGHVVDIKRLADYIGEENLSQEEADLLHQFSGLNKFVSVYSRFDKLTFGVEDEIDENGNYKQIGEKITAYADDMEKKYVENEISKKQKTAERGLDFDKIMKKKYSKLCFCGVCGTIFDAI